jgi:hypothetical protein
MILGAKRCGLSGCNPRPEAQLQWQDILPLATDPNMPSAEMSSGEGQGKEGYYMARAHCGKRESEHFNHL